MDPEIWIALIVLALVVGAALGWFLLKAQRSRHLRSRFGPEYEHEVERTGDRRVAEKTLERREQRVKKLEIRPLPPAEQQRFAEAWRAVQARFVDEPARAVAEADRLVREVMRARGYPTSDFEQQAEDISVDHPHVVENYRAAHDLALRSERGQASTEDLRQAMVHYRALFEDLLETEITSRKEVGV